MKVLIDPVYTGRPSTCSTSYVAWKNIKAIAEKWPDAYFYLTYPKEWWEDEDEVNWVVDQEFSERVTLHFVDKMTTDRLTDLLLFPRDILDIVSPTAKESWDADIIVTTRIPQIGMYRANSSRRVGYGKGTYRGIFGLDDMPMLQFRDTVAWGNTGEFDIHTMGQYLMSDGLILSDLWTKQKMLTLSREYFAPSRVMELREHVQEALPVKLTQLQMAPKFTPGETFNVVFAGRITGTRNFKGVADLLRKQYSYPLGKGPMKFIATTNSQSIGSINAGEIDFIEFQHNNRAQFHALLKEKAHVIVNLSTVEDFSLSTYEPLTFGVPVIVPRRPWADFLGKDYPFRADDIKEAYALISLMATDYEAQYAKFKAWHDTTWMELVNGPRNRSTSEVLVGMIDRHMTDMLAYVESHELGGAYRDAVKTIVEGPDDEIDIVPWMVERGLTEWDKKWERIPVSKRPSLHLMKLLLNLAGFRDMQKCGLVTRKPIE